MFNLLPQQQQHELVREYRVRFATTALLFLAFLGAISLSALIPSLMLSYEKETAVTQNEKALQKEIALVIKDNISSVLADAKEKVSVLQATTTSPYAYELIDTITKGKPAQIALLGVSVKSMVSGHEVSLLGKATTRDALLAFTKKLQTEKMFSEVTVPVSNFAEATDINFSLIIKAK